MRVSLFPWLVCFCSFVFGVLAFCIVCIMCSFCCSWLNYCIFLIYNNLLYIAVSVCVCWYMLFVYAVLVVLKSVRNLLIKVSHLLSALNKYTFRNGSKVFKAELVSW